jgi:hypothetical protein
MGYFDSFTTAPDGRRLFSPWGAYGRTYVIESELDCERLRRRAKIGVIVVNVLVTIGMSMLVISKHALPLFLYSFVTIAVLEVALGTWRQYLLRGLASPAERLSWQEGATLRARGWAQRP